MRPDPHRRSEAILRCEGAGRGSGGAALRIPEIQEEGWPPRQSRDQGTEASGERAAEWRYYDGMFRRAELPTEPVAVSVLLGRVSHRWLHGGTARVRDDDHRRGHLHDDHDTPPVHP